MFESVSPFDLEPDFSNVCFDNLEDISNAADKDFVDSLESVAAGVKLGATNVKTPGRILGKIEAYVEAGASDYVLETVSLGYKLVFEGGVPPPPSFKPNNRSALQKPEFTYSELLSLESLGCIKRFSSCPYIVNPVSIVFFF